MLKKLSSLFLVLLFSSYCYCLEGKDDWEGLRKLEGFLQKNKQSMEKVGKGKYRVSDDQFDEIFPSCYFSLNPNINFSVGMIENEFTDITSGETNIAIGTGTVILNKTNNINVITAKHVLEKKGLVTFTLARGLVLPGSDQISLLAEYVSDKIYFHNTLDIAIVSFNLQEKHVSKELLSKVGLPTSHNLIQTRKYVEIYHYPFGTDVQRFNRGAIIENTNNHTIPTLGGSSGAPLIVNGEIVGIHSGAHEFGGGTVEIQGTKLNFSNHNYFARMSSVLSDFSDFIERS